MMMIGNSSIRVDQNHMLLLHGRLQVLSIPGISHRLRLILIRTNFRTEYLMVIDKIMIN